MKRLIPISFGIMTLLWAGPAAAELGKKIIEVVENDLETSGLFRSINRNAFLQEVQQRMGAFTGQNEPLLRVAREVAQEARLLCFDEFHVHDIADAMLLGRLLKVLVEEGVGLVCTSNYAPINLCPNPLYRDRFKPAIELLETRFSVINLDAGEDYRERAGAQEAWGYFAWPLCPELCTWLEHLLDLSAAAERDLVLEVNHHPLKVLAREGDRALLDFDELCRRPHSSADFLWLCQRFRRIAIYGVPCLDNEGIDVQQRILNFVDIAYDSGVHLLLGCAAELDQVCRPGSHLDFVRTRSRLRQLTPQAFS